MKEMMNAVEARNRVLGTWTKEKFDLTRIKTLWDQLLHLMDNYHSVIGRQVCIREIYIRNRFEIRHSLLTK
jgi:hypothetical protein